MPFFFFFIFFFFFFFLLFGAVDPLCIVYLAALPTDPPEMFTYTLILYSWGGCSDMRHNIIMPAVHSSHIQTSMYMIFDLTCDLNNWSAVCAVVSLACVAAFPRETTLHLLRLFTFHERRAACRKRIAWTPSATRSLTLLRAAPRLPWSPTWPTALSLCRPYQYRAAVDPTTSSLWATPVTTCRLVDRTWDCRRKIYEHVSWLLFGYSWWNGFLIGGWC